MQEESPNSEQDVLDRFAELCKENSVDILRKIVVLAFYSK